MNTEPKPRAKVAPWPNRLGYVVTVGRLRFEVWSERGAAVRIRPDPTAPCGFVGVAYREMPTLTTTPAAALPEMLAAAWREGGWTPCE